MALAQPDEPDATVDRVTAVLDVVDTIPPGQVMTYGDIARWLGIASPRQVGQILAHHGHRVPWHRVVMADGRAASPHSEEQLARLRDDGVPVRGNRVELRTARWRPH